ncbi:unnamed protein product, partial [Dibothriocephalus latus]
MTYVATQADGTTTSLTITDTEGRVLRRPWTRDRQGIKTGVVRPLVPVALSTNCSVDLSPEGVCVRDSIEFEFTCPNGGETNVPTTATTTPAATAAVNGSSQDFPTHRVNRTKG